MLRFRLARSVNLQLSLRVMAALPCVLLLTQCQTTPKKSYKSAEYSPDKLATPPGHGMTKKHYPFDDQGHYRKDWVRNQSNSRAKSSYKGFASSSSSETAQTTSDTRPRTEPRSSSPYPDYVGNSSSPPPVSQPDPKPSARYHKVVSGDTLYSLSRRYGVSVSSLKQTNGLSGDLIRQGQSLRIP